MALLALSSSLLIIKTCYLRLELIGGSSQAQMFFKIGALKNFAHFTRKQLCWSILFIKLLAWRPATLLKRDSNTGVFLWIFGFHINFAKFLITFFLIQHLRWLPLWQCKSNDWFLYEVQHWPELIINEIISVRVF